MGLLRADARGVFVIAVTPFTADLRIDMASIDTVTDFYFDKGADGLTILGMMGEAPKLTHEEALSVTRRTLQRAGDRPVVVGVSSPGLAAMSELTKAVMDMGAAGVMVAPPSTLRTDEQITTYYRNVVDTLGSDVPIVLQDFPLATSVQISASTLNAIFAQLPSIVMLKHEDWPGLEKVSALRKAEAGGQRGKISILCGNGGIFLPEEMRRGADGAMTGFGFPEMMVDVCRLSDRGEHDRAEDLFEAYLPLVRYEQQPGIGLAVRKHVLAKRGAIASATQRRPGAALSRAGIEEVERILARQASKLEAFG